MSARFRLHHRISGLVALLSTALGVAPLAGTSLAAEAATAGHHVRIARQRPDCSPPADMPVVPTDPGAYATLAGRPCSPALSLTLPEGRYVWLREGARSPGAWVPLGPADADSTTPPPSALGLKLSITDQAWILESRRGRAAALTPLHPGRWVEVDPPGGTAFWIMVDDAGAPRLRGRGRVRSAD